MDMRRELLSEHHTGWMELSACQDREDLFVHPGQQTPAAHARVNTAMLICKICPVLYKCRSWAMDLEIEGHDWVDVVIAGRYYPNTRSRKKGNTTNVNRSDEAEDRP